jgi:predicted transcriptional regulator
MSQAGCLYRHPTSVIYSNLNIKIHGHYFLFLMKLQILYNYEQLKAKSDTITQRGYELEPVISRES